MLEPGDMEDQIRVQALLNEHLTKVRSRNASISLRAFAKKIGMSHSSVSEILNGRRRVSRRLAERIADKLLLDPQQRAELLAAFPKRKDVGAVPVPSKYLELSADQFQVISEWYHFAILSLMRTDDFQNDAEWIAKRLGIQEKEALRALERLKNLNMIEENSDGGLRRAKSAYRTSDDVINLSVRRSHYQDLELAKDALDHVPVELRDATSITLPTSPRLLPVAKERIRKFQDDLAELMEAEDKPEVYRLAIHLFPLTRLQQENRT